MIGRGVYPRSRPHARAHQIDCGPRSPGVLIGISAFECEIGIPDGLANEFFRTCKEQILHSSLESRHRTRVTPMALSMNRYQDPFAVDRTAETR